MNLFHETRVSIFKSAVALPGAAGHVQLLSLMTNVKFKGANVGTDALMTQHQSQFFYCLVVWSNWQRWAFAQDRQKVRH